MKVFISWSGARSKAVADLMRDWLKCVIQASEPWISSRDMDRGGLWFSEINNKLKDTSIGVVCITQENKSNPWILFEAGALAKGLSSSRVCTFLIDLAPTDLKDPLAQFNHTLPTRAGLFSLTATLNGLLEDKTLESKILEQVFNTYWPQFEKGFQDAIKANKPTEIVPPRPDGEILSEILASTRALSRRMSELESRSGGLSRGQSLASSNQLNESLDYEFAEEFNRLQAQASLNPQLAKMLDTNISSRDRNRMMHQLEGQFDASEDYKKFLIEQQRARKAATDAADKAAGRASPRPPKGEKPG